MPIPVNLNTFNAVAAVTTVAQSSSSAKIEEAKATRTEEKGADGTGKIDLSVKVSGLKPGTYSIYLGDTSRKPGENVVPGKTEWIQGESKKMFSADELAKGVKLAAWCADGPKYITVANAESDVVAAPSKKIIVQ